MSDRRCFNRSHARAALRASRSIAAAVQSLEPRRLLAAVNWDGGGDGISWVDANNWSTNTLPLPADDVTINLAANPTINLAGANAVINSLNTDENLNLNSGTLSLAAASSASATATVTMGSATLAGAGTFTVNGPLAFNNGTMSGSGTLIAKGTTTIGSGGAYTTLADTRTLRIDGPATFSSAGGYNTNVATNARIRVASGGTLAIANGSEVVGTGAIIVDAGGALTRTAAGTGTMLLQVQNSGAVTAAAGSTLNLNSSVTTGGSFGGAGTIQTYGGTHTFDNATTAASVTYNHISGTIDGPGTLTTHGPFNWTNGVIQGSGTISLRGESTLGSGSGYTYLRGMRTVRMDAGVTTFANNGGYNTQVAADARIAVGNGGTLDANIVGGDTQVLGDGGNGKSAINVEAGGKLTRTAATGANNIAIPVNNLGTIDVDVAYMNLLGGGTNAASNTPASGTTLGLGGNWIYNDGTTMSGGGTIALYGGSHTVNDGPAAATINVAGDGTTLSIDNGTFEGAGQTSVAAGGTFAFRRGVLQGTATTTVFGTTLVGAGNGYSSIQGTHTLRVRGAGSFGLAGGYHTSLSANARLVAGAGGTLDASSTGDFRLFGVAAGNVGAVVVEPGGTLTRTAAGQEYIDIPVINQGGTISASTGATLSINAGSTSASGSVFAGAGTVHLRDGNHSIDGATTVAVGGTLLLSTGPGAIVGTSTLTVNGFLDLHAGSLSGSVTTLILGTSNVGSGGGYVDINDTHQLRVGNGGVATHTTAGGYDVRVAADARIAIASGGTYNFGANGNDMQLFGVGGTGGTGLMVIEAGGTLTRTAAGGDTLNLPVQNAGTIRAVAGSDLGIGAGSSQLAGATIAGPGRIVFNGGTHSIDGATTVAVGGTLVHDNSTLTGASTLTVDGTYNFNRGSMNGSGATILRGTASTLGGGGAYTNVNETRTIRVEGTTTISTSGGYDIRFASGTNLVVASTGTLVLAGASELHNVSGSSIGTLTIEFGGTLQRAVGGTAQISMSVINLGTVRIDAGAINFSGATNADDGAFLSSGRYLVFSGGNLVFSPALTTLTADVELSGTGGASGLGVLAVNRGRVGLVNGADGQFDPAGATRFRNEGILDLSPTSVLTVVGGMDFGGTSQPIVRSEIASATDFGRIIVTGGSVDLNSPNSTSRFDPDLIGAYDPAVGTQFPILTAPSRLNTFDNIQGGLTPSNNVIAAYTTPTVYGAQIVPGPPPPAPQILSQGYEYQTREAVVFNFNQDVSAFLGRKDYQLVNMTTGLPVAQDVGTLTYNTSSNQATLTLTNQLPNGDYRLTVNASDIANSVGTPASGAPIVINFFVLRGDANRDRTVNFDDLLILAQNYGNNGMNYSQGNFNYSTDGLISFDDLLLISQNYGVSLVTAPAPIQIVQRFATRSSRNVADVMG